MRPRIVSLKINPEKIGALIGPRRQETSSGIVEESGLRDQYRRRWNGEHLLDIRGGHEGSAKGGCRGDDR